MVLSADVIIIGAGPSGSVSGALLAQAGYNVIILEQSKFPRFSIGESLLPQCMHFLEEANLLTLIQKANFQYKNGAAFEYGHKHTDFHFEEKYTPGWGTTFQVERDKFDKILADGAEDKGVTINYEEKIIDININKPYPEVISKNSNGENKIYNSRFILDASGFGRVLPRLLKLEVPSTFPIRQSTFTHIQDNIKSSDFDREKILITVHPKEKNIWYWLIPLSNGRSSIGIVGEPKLFNPYNCTPEKMLKSLISEAPGLRRRLENAKWDKKVNQITGYSSNVKSLYGDKFALLGNAGEFLDPVFSSGVTIALKSASLAANTLIKQFKGEKVCWNKDFQKPLKTGIDTFRCYVESWYDHSFQDIIFSSHQNKAITNKISSILAGYAWDISNPFVKHCNRKISQLAKISKEYN